MKKLSVLVIAILCGIASTYAQEDFFTPPDFRQIERNIQNPASSFFYPKLMERYLAGDSTLTADEGKHLYFGYVFQPAYVPADDSRYNQRLASVLSRTSLTETDFREILEIAQALLQEDPFNLRALNAVLLVLAQGNNVAEYKKIARQRHIVQDAIVSTGDGMSETTPFFVIRVAHEYDMLPFLGFRFGGEDRRLRGGRMNFLSLAENRFGVERLYFDTSAIIDYLNRRGGGRM
jgi:hypothetical protein